MYGSAPLLSVLVCVPSLLQNQDVARHETEEQSTSSPLSAQEQAVLADMRELVAVWEELLKEWESLFQDLNLEDTSVV